MTDRDRARQESPPDESDSPGGGGGGGRGVTLPDGGTPPSGADDTPEGADESDGESEPASSLRAAETGETGVENGSEGGSVGAAGGETGESDGETGESDGETGESWGYGNPPPPPEGNNRAEGNSGGGAPVGNSNAVGNDGGAPAGNQHARRHGLHADPANVLEDLKENDPGAYAWVESKVQGYLEDAPFGDGTPKADQLRQVAVREFSIWQASGIQLREGVVKQTHERTSDGELVEVESEHPANLPLDRMERTVTKRLKDLGVLGDEGGSQSQEGLESDAYRVVDVESRDQGSDTESESES